MMIALAPVAGEAELSDPDVTGQFAPQMAEIAQMRQIEPWCGYIARRNGQAVGFGGFKMVPDADGAVEIGYLTFPAHEGSGVASATADGLAKIARQNGATSVFAHTLCEDNASTGVLRNNGFVRNGESIDPEEGTVWRWEKAL